MEYTVEQIEPDVAGIAFFLSKYKPFRLNALQTDPDFFGSNYAREVAMDDSFWERRILRPAAKTFVAVRAQDRSILSSLTISRGAPVSPLLGMHIGLSSEECDANSSKLIHWVITAVYTARDARRQGISKALFEYALALAAKGAKEENKACLVTMHASSRNEVALGMYKKLGFTMLSSVDDQEDVVLYLMNPR